jgi:hypothetical protein
MPRGTIGDGTELGHGSIGNYFFYLLFLKQNRFFGLFISGLNNLVRRVGVGRRAEPALQSLGIPGSLGVGTPSPAH